MRADPNTAPPSVEYRAQFHQGLAALEAQMQTMATHARQALELSSQALKTSDLQLCDQVIAGDDRIDDEYRQIERRAVELLGRQQPVASDLRLLVALIHSALHLERIGDMAVDIAEATRSSVSLEANEEILGRLGYMATTAASMTELAVEALVSRNAALCERLPQLDEHVDELHHSMIDDVLRAGGNPDRLEWAVRMFQVSRYLERAADHAVDIAEQAWFLITGELRELD